MTFSEFAKKKVLGVPVLYIAGAAVAIFAVVAWKMKPASSGDSSTDGEVPPDAGGPHDVPPDYSGLNSNGTVIVQPTPVPDQNADKQTNEEWERTAIQLLIDDKKATPTEAQAAIHTYMEGGNLTYDQGVLKDYAVGKMGLPPEPMPVIGQVGPKPAQKQFSHFPGHHTVKGNSDNTSSKLAALYYGNGDSLHAIKIAASSPNEKLGPNGTTYPVGTVVYIPGWTNPKYYYTTKDVNWPSEVARKNALSYDSFLAFNPGLTAPYKPGTKVRVG